VIPKFVFASVVLEDLRLRWTFCGEFRPARPFVEGKAQHFWGEDVVSDERTDGPGDGVEDGCHDGGYG